MRLVNYFIRVNLYSNRIRAALTESTPVARTPDTGEHQPPRRQHVEQVPRAPGRIRPAPENFLTQDGIQAVRGEARTGRRDFIRGAFAAAVAALAAPQVARAQANPVPADGGDSSILNLPEHTTGLGQPVVTDGYGKPSKY